MFASTCDPQKRSSASFPHTNIVRYITDMILAKNTCLAKTTPETRNIQCVRPIAAGGGGMRFDQIFTGEYAERARLN